MHFSAEARKNEKKPRRNIFLVFQEMELFGYNIKKNSGNANPAKNSLYFRKWKLSKSFLYFRNETFQSTLKNFLYFLKRRLFLYFWKRKSRKNLLYLRKRNFFIFHEVIYKTWKLKNSYTFSKLKYLFIIRIKCSFHCIIFFPILNQFIFSIFW